MLVVWLPGYRDIAGSWIGRPLLMGCGAFRISWRSIYIMLDLYTVWLKDALARLSTRQSTHHELCIIEQYRHYSLSHL